MKINDITELFIKKINYRTENFYFLVKTMDFISIYFRKLIIINLTHLSSIFLHLI